MQRDELDKATRATVLQRDNFSCFLCRKRGVEIHEILPRSALGKSKSELLFNEKNRVCLCRECHCKVHNRTMRAYLLKHMTVRYNYLYDEPEFQKYLGEEDIV